MKLFQFHNQNVITISKLKQKVLVSCVCQCKKGVDYLKYQCDVSSKSLISCHEFIRLILGFFLGGGSLLPHNDIMIAIWVYNCHLMMSIQKTFFIKIWKIWMFYHIAIIFLSYKHTEKPVKVIFLDDQNMILNKLS